MPDLIESNADLVKWCVHILGPDDVIARRSHAEAVKAADALNRINLLRPGVTIGTVFFAYAAPWRYGETSWRDNLPMDAP